MALEQNIAGDASSSLEGSRPKDRLRFVVLTTCHAAGWQQYGRRMVETFEQFWPGEIPLYLYAEDFEPDHLRPMVAPAGLAR